MTFNQRDFTGMSLDDVYPKDSPVVGYLKGLYRDLHRTKRPLWSVNNLVHPRTGRHLVMRRLMLPLSSDGETVTMSLAVQTMETNAETGSNPILIWHKTPAVVERDRRFL